MKCDTLWKLHAHGYTFFSTETIASLQAFRKRHGDAQRLNAQYASQPTTVDFAHYRTILKNKAIVDEAEKLLKDFKPVTYDVNAQVKAIEAFETKAVSSCQSIIQKSEITRVYRGQVAKAQETEAKIDVELKELQATLANIEDARPFDELTVRFHLMYQFRLLIVDLKTEDVGRAHPRIVEAVETMLKKGKWTVPGKYGTVCYKPFRWLCSATLLLGYKEKFGDLNLM